MENSYLLIEYKGYVDRNTHLVYTRFRVTKPCCKNNKMLSRVRLGPIRSSA